MINVSGKPKILFVYDLPPDHAWMDGLWAALNLLEEDFEITRYNVNESIWKPDVEKRGPAWTMSFDFTLVWGAFGSRADKFIQGGYAFHRKRGLCLAGNANSTEGADNYDILFYETPWHRKEYLKWVDDSKTKLVHAFGINADLFAPTDLSFPVIWDYIGVGAMAAWKRWDKMVTKPGRKLVVGYYQDQNEAESGEIVRQLLRHNVMVSNQLNPYDLLVLYYCSRTAYIPADLIGGGERSVLEARACGLTVEVEEDNPKLKGLLDCPIWDHHYYAKQLKEGILSLL